MALVNVGIGDGQTTIIDQSNASSGDTLGLTLGGNSTLIVRDVAVSISNFAGVGAVGTKTFAAEDGGTLNYDAGTISVGIADQLVLAPRGGGTINYSPPSLSLNTNNTIVDFGGTSEMGAGKFSVNPVSYGQTYIVKGMQAGDIFEIRDEDSVGRVVPGMATQAFRVPTSSEGSLWTAPSGGNPGYMTLVSSTSSTFLGSTSQSSSGKIYVRIEMTAAQWAVVQPTLSSHISNQNNVGGFDIQTFTMPAVAVPVVADDTVQGTAGDDVMLVGYRDADGTYIDGPDGIHDIIYGYEGNDSITAGEGNDVVYGGDGNDTILGGNGDDTLRGDAGDDHLHGEGGNNLIYGGDGDDTVTVGDGNNTIYGDAGDDLLIGADGNDRIFGGTGNDQINGEDGTDYIEGGDGEDTIWSGERGESTVYGGAGNDSIDGGEDNDSLYGGADDDTITGWQGDDYIKGGAGKDSIYAGDGNDLIHGDFEHGSTLTGGGADTIYGGAGDDTIYGGVGNDLLSGGFEEGWEIPGTGNDQIFGESGDDTIYGGDGDDGVYGGGDGIKLLFGGDGDDSIYIGYNTDQSSIYGGLGNDTIMADNSSSLLDGGDGDDVVYGGDGAETIWGGTGNDILASGAGNDEIYGGDDNDTIVAGYGDDLVHGDDGDDEVYGEAGRDTLYGGDGADTIFGGNDDDLIYGDAGDDSIEGEAGNDTLYGGDGHDIIKGGEGNDSIEGGDGNDTIHGGSGDNTIYGGSGDDEIYGGDSGTGGTNLLDGGDGDDTILAGAGSTGDASLYGGAGNDELHANDAGSYLDGGDDNDKLIGGDGNDTLIGGTGDDFLTSWGGDDYIDAGAGDDSVDAGEGQDTVYGGAGDDILYGGAGDDTLYGGLGNDIIGGDGASGAVGRDHLYGGLGHDKFIVAGADTIHDFDATTGITGDGATTYDGTNDFVDLSRFYNDQTLADWNAANPTQTYKTPIEWMRADYAGEIGAAGVLEGADGLVILNGSDTIDPSLFNGENTGVICFGQGTMILTCGGEVAVEDLKAGDLVWTEEAGFEPLLWVGTKTVTLNALQKQPNLAPVTFAAGSLGLGLPVRDLTVTRQHRMVISTNGMHAAATVIIPAKDFIGMVGVEVDNSQKERTFYHLLLKQHRTLHANGVPTESLYDGMLLSELVTPKNYMEIRALLGTRLMTMSAPELRGKKAAKLIAAARAAGRLFSPILDHELSGSARRGGAKGAGRARP